MRLISNILISVILALSLQACEKKNDPAPQTTDRTILVYMIASNNLGDPSDDPEDPRSFDQRDLDEMKLAASKGNLANSRWLVYHHPRKGEIQLKELTKKGFKTLKRYSPETYSVSINRMTEVFDDMRSLAPADDYGLILWSHATGWLETGIDEPTLSTSSKKPRSYGDDRGKQMNIKSLRSALETTPFSFVYADVCNLAAVEVAYELRNVTPAFVASAAQMPANGMPYDLNMRYLTSTKPDLVAAARSTVEYYRSRPAIEHLWCTVSVISTGALDDLARETARIYRSSAYPDNYTPKPLDYSFRYYSDLGHFVDAMSPADKSWHDALDRAVIYAGATESMLGMPLDPHCGLSTYILSSPAASDNSGYSTLQWYKDVAKYQPMQK